MGITIIPKNRRTQDGEGNPINSLGGALDVHDADSHTFLINRHFINFDTVTESPNTAIVSGDTTILVDDTTGFVDGTFIVIKDAAGDMREHHFEVTSIVGGTSITLDRPVDLDYTTNAVLEVVLMNMAPTVGTLTAPIIYEVAPPSDEVWHITRLLISIVDNGIPDDGKFGGIPAIENGVTVRENKTVKNTITNWKTNGAMVEDMFDVTYTDSAPAGENGVRGRFTFTNAGAISKLDGSLGDKLEILIQDDLSALSTFRIKAQGHKEGE